MNVRMLQHLPSYREFQQETQFKEYRKFPGVLLRFFGHAQTIIDEQGIKHYVRKDDLRRLDRDLYRLPELNHRILLDKVLKCLIIELQFPGELFEDEREGIEAFVKKKYDQFTASGLDHKTYDSSGEPSFSIEFRRAADKLSIFLEIPGLKAFDLVTGKNKELQFYWPENLNLLGITEEERQKLDDLLNGLKDQLSTERLEHPWKLERKVEDLPLSLLIVPGGDGTVGKVFLLPRSEKVGIVGEGSYKAVKKAYDLTSGDFLVKKITSEREGQTVKNLQDQKRVLKLRAETKKVVNGENMLRQYEPLADGTLRNIVGRSMTKKQKVDLIKQLLKALNAFHEKTTQKGSRYYHGDIKPDNILYKQEADGTIQLFFADFGFTNRRSIAGSPAWISPEHAVRWLKLETLDPQDRKVQGNELDVWAIGLVIASLLAGRNFPREFLKCESEKDETLEALCKLTQADVDEQILRYQGLERDSGLKRNWDIVRGMLSVDPKERWAAEQALEQFQEIN